MIHQNYRQHGRWHVRNTRVVWVIAGRELAVNAKSATITNVPLWSAPETLSGQVIINQNREYDEVLPGGAVRPGMIRDQPFTISLTFPSLPVAFYRMMRPLRTFSRSFNVELSFLDALDPVPLITKDQQNYYAPFGGWKANSLTLYRNKIAIDAALEPHLINPEYGYVHFPDPQPYADEIQATYVWSPRVTFDGTLSADFAAGREVRQGLQGWEGHEAEVTFTLRELRPPAAAVDAIPAAGFDTMDFRFSLFWSPRPTPMPRGVLDEVQRDRLLGRLEFD